MKGDRLGFLKFYKSSSHSEPEVNESTTREMPVVLISSYQNHDFVLTDVEDSESCENRNGAASALLHIDESDGVDEIGRQRNKTKRRFEPRQVQTGTVDPGRWSLWGHNEIQIVQLHCGCIFLSLNHSHCICFEAQSNVFCNHQSSFTHLGLDNAAQSTLTQTLTQERAS